MGKIVDIAGQRFGRLTAIKRVGRIVGGALWLCKCECGNNKEVRLGNLKRGMTRSCGCIERERPNRTTHGAYRTSENIAWMNMIQRCTNSNDPRWPHYGGRGITVCARWRNSFADFLADVGPKPAGTTLDRENNDGNYEPGNVRWVNHSRQMRNTRRTHHLTHDGKTQTVPEWSKELGISESTIHTRLFRGWSVEQALTTKPNPRLATKAPE